MRVVLLEELAEIGRKQDRLRLMSALGGVFYRCHAQASTDATAALLSSLVHCGSCSGRWCDSSIGFIHLQTVNASEPHQDSLPRLDTATGLAITAVSRLDNRGDLSAALGVDSLERSAITNSELIARAYQKWGGACPEYLLGDFAFAIWDARQQTLFCARDHIGAVPFYYNLSPQRFVFASDIKGVLAAPGISTKLDEPFVASALAEQIPYRAERTFFESVRKLPPSHTLTLTPQSERLERYWFPAQARDVRFGSFAEYEEAFLDLYTRVIRDCLRVEGPLGIHVTGGLDSSSIAVLAARHLREQGRALPLGFCWEPEPQGEPRIDQALIQSVCSQQGLTLQHQSLRSEDVVEFLSRDIAVEVTTSTLLHEQLTQRQAQAQGVRVMLSGWGGDEVMTYNGRAYHAGLLAQGRWRELRRECRKNGLWNRTFLFRRVLGPLLPAPLQPWLHRNERRGAPGGAQTARTSYANREFARRVKRLARPPLPVIGVGVHAHQLQQLESGHITERLESWYAHGVRHNLHYRYPLLDRRILEFALGLPSEIFRRDVKHSRLLIRKSMDGVLPPDVCWNTDKSDPARVGAYKKATRSALANIGQQLKENPRSPSRAAYLDMPRLMRDLEPEALESQQWQGLFRALQFLDFDGTT